MRRHQKILPMKLVNLSGGYCKKRSKSRSSSTSVDCVLQILIPCLISPCNSEFPFPHSSSCMNSSPLPRTVILTSPPSASFSAFRALFLALRTAISTARISASTPASCGSKAATSWTAEDCALRNEAGTRRPNWRRGSRGLGWGAGVVESDSFFDTVDSALVGLASPSAAEGRCGISGSAAGGELEGVGALASAIVKVGIGSSVWDWEGGFSTSEAAGGDGGRVVMCRRRVACIRAS